MATPPVFLPRKSHGWRNIQSPRAEAGYSPWGCKESDTTEHATHTRKKRDGTLNIECKSVYSGSKQIEY